MALAGAVCRQWSVVSRNRSTFVLLLSTVFLLLTTSSCLFVKAPKQDEGTGEEAPLSPQPQMAMGDELIRSPQGDMIALLPEGWQLLDTKTEVSDFVITVAVNPEYTLSAVFATIPPSGSTLQAVDDDGLLGLARVAFTQRSRKTAGAVDLVGTYSLAELGTREFGLYKFKPSAGSLTSRCAVFTSTLGNYYEFSLVPINVSGRDIPADADQHKVFSSILATIQY